MTFLLNVLIVMLSAFFLAYLIGLLSSWQQSKRNEVAFAQAEAHRKRLESERIEATQRAETNQERIFVLMEEQNDLLRKMVSVLQQTASNASRAP